MATTAKDDLLRKLPSIDGLLATETVAGWLDEYPRSLVVWCLRQIVEGLRRQIVEDSAGSCGPAHVTEQYVLGLAAEKLTDLTTPNLRAAINATGVILHTGLGRAVWPKTVTESLTEELKGYVTLAIDRATGKRSERHLRVESILTELTGAEAATVVNNNAAATLIVLAAMAAGREAIVSRGQLIEIGGSFRLPDVMAQSGATLVEVGTTNRTHLKDYRAAITEQTALIMRVHPSNFRVVGFTSEVPLEELSELAHSRGLTMVDDLGAGALVDLTSVSGGLLPHEPTVTESVAAGADVVLFSADKLIGASQGGIIVGKTEPIERIRTHPLYRAMRVDKACLMALERTLHLFRDPERLTSRHPLYRMLTMPLDVLQQRAEKLAGAIRQAAPAASVETAEGVGYLGSGSLPTEQLPTFLVTVALAGQPAEELARRLRGDRACIFTRIENERVVIDVRTLLDGDAEKISAALGRIVE